jgi:hypothetical protein
VRISGNLLSNAPDDQGWEEGLYRKLRKGRQKFQIIFKYCKQLIGMKTAAQTNKNG